MSNNNTNSIKLIKNPTTIPVPGGKLIEEFIGRINSGDSNVSVAHMIAPANWSEEPQTPEFDEITIMMRGRMQVETPGKTIVLSAGEVFFVQKGIKICYSNPFDEENEYWAICIPAFSVELAGR
jgi:mannose-6-phosphate isomerase-like protein (cupin superfamily)